MRYRDILFSLLQSYEISIVYSQYKLSFFRYFCGIFYDENSKPIGFVLLLNGCDDGDLIQEDIDFEYATMQSCSTNDIILQIKDKSLLGNSSQLHLQLSRL
jgi:hypothetical protein